jgi:hypothetical protein
MKSKSKNHELKASSVDPKRITAPRWTAKKDRLFWDWFIEVSDDWLQELHNELAVDHNLTKAFDRVRAKTRKAEAALRKELSSMNEGRKH